MCVCVLKIFVKTILLNKHNVIFMTRFINKKIVFFYLRDIEDYLILLLNGLFNSVDRKI